MRIVFGCGEDEFGRLDNAGVEIYRPGNIKSQLFGKFLFKFIGLMFNLGKFAGVDEFFDADKLPQDVFANLVFVIVGLGKRPDVAC